MIIHSVRARNLLKYAELKLDGLPARGIIAISGENESGKSSIGEAICFALFGRTFSHGQDQLDKVLRWGESRCSVVIEFTVEGTRYQLGRFLDRDGNMGARLAPALQPEETLARGAARVSEQLYKILGYEFEEFIESFYLAQREITTPHPHSVAVKIMAGLAPLEQVADDFRHEIAEADERLEELDTEIQTLREEQEELDFEEGRLIRLEDHKNEVERQYRDSRERLEALEQAVGEYETHWPRWLRAGRKARRARFWRNLSLLAILAASGLWALLRWWPDAPAVGALASWMAQAWPGWRSEWIDFIGLGGLGGLGVALLLELRRRSQRRHLAEHQARLDALSPALQQARRVEPAPEEACQEGDSGEATAAPQRPDEGAYARLLVQVDAHEAPPESLAGYLTAETGWIRHQLELEQALLTRLEAEVDQEIERLEQMARLAETIAGLEARQAEIRAEQERRRRAIELLEGAARDFSHDFNRDIRDLVARTLPIFTQERYQHLRIEPDLSVNVFSADKHDFMDLDEVSSGTQRQIMLALRLALSQKLLARKVKGYQFAFLDEPFAFFDQERTRHALQALSGLSEQLAQLWIVAQDFPPGADVSFARQIHCQRGRDVLLA